MNTMKWGLNNCGLLAEADRSMYRDAQGEPRRDTVSRSLIDAERSGDNYNLCPHEQYTRREIAEIHRRIRGKELRRDGVAMGCTIITQPKDYAGDSRAFFDVAYRELLKLYKLQDEDVVSAWVHMDETTPHMHFYFLPRYRPELHPDKDGKPQGKDSMAWDKVFPRSMYQKQHKYLQRSMTRQLKTEVNLLNDETLGINNINKLTREEKRMGIKSAKERRSELLREIDDMWGTLETLRRQCAAEYNALEAGKRKKAGMEAKLRELQEEAAEALKMRDNASREAFAYGRKAETAKSVYAEAKVLAHEIVTANADKLQELMERNETQVMILEEYA